FLELQKADDLEQITEHMRRASEGEMLSNVEVRHSRKDGTTFDAILTVSQVRDQKGEVIAIHGIYKDITERRKAEQELRRAHEETKQAYRALERTQASAVAAEKLAAVGLLTAGVSHEILNPLNIIILRLHTLIGNPDTPPEVTRNLRIMEKHANRITKITRDLLSFSRQREPELRLIDLNESIKRTLSLLEHGLRIQNIEVESKLSDELPPGLADQDQLQQMVLNLTTNAKDAKPDGGHLSLTTKAVQTNGQMFIELRVEDTGEGIAPEDLENLFDPFFTTKDEGKGTGLGLSICQGIVEDYGGSIWAENVPDGGAAFVVRFGTEDE
ncbi:MAG: ATP-binding protein, partial [bacterium]|nr:ATP-binding protein [bacterium]